MVRQRVASVDDFKTFRSMPKKDKVAFLKGHHLLKTCSKNKPGSLPKPGELVWARVLGSVYWPGFILELDDLEQNELDAIDSEDIDDSAYGFVMFLESTYRYAPVAWDQMIRFQDLESQILLLPSYNHLVVKRTWKKTTIFKSSLKLAIEFSQMTEKERLTTAIARYQAAKKSLAKPTTIAAPESTNKEETESEDDEKPEDAINKVVSAAKEKKKSGIRVSDRIHKKQIIKLKPKPEPAVQKTDKEKTETPKISAKPNKNVRPDTGGEVLKQWTKNRFDQIPKQHLFESSNVQCRQCDMEIETEESVKTCHGMPFHEACLEKQENGALKCEMCINQLCFLCKLPGEGKENQVLKCSRCELRFHIDCLLKDWPQAEIQGSSGPIICPLHFCHTCLGEQKIYCKFRDYTTSASRSYRCRICLSSYHKTCLPAGCGESIQGKEYIICPKHTLPDLKVQQRRIGCLTCCKALKPKEDKIECSYCVQTFHPACVGYTEEIQEKVSLEVFGQGYKCYSCKWGLFPLYGQVVWFQQPQHQYWPARILFPVESKQRSNAKRLPGQYSIEYLGSTSYYDNASRVLPLHLTTVDIFKSMKVYQEVPKILRAHEEAVFSFMFAEEHRDKQLQKPKPVYKKIDRNVYRTVSVQKVKEPVDICSCHEEKSEFVCQPDDGCPNRDMEMECSDRICKGGSRCSNRMFSERKNDEEFLDQKLFPNKGWGVVAKKPFKRGDFVAEYRGEVIDRNEMKWRLNKKEEEDPMYILEISKEFFIDAEYVGNLSRLINHSCDPNCEVRKYLSLGKSVGGIFAKRPIEVGEEVTFRYGCGSQSTAPFRCRCGAGNCAVFVGKDVPDDFMLDEDTEQNQDKWDDVCSKCGFGGRVICCEFPGCGKVWHYQCVNLKRQPTKNWCCPEHPTKKVDQLKKASEANKKSSNKLKGLPIKPSSTSSSSSSSTSSSSSSSSSKNVTPISQQPPKKKARQTTQASANVELTKKMDAVEFNEKRVSAPKPQKRRLSEKSSAVEFGPSKKKQKINNIPTKADASTQISQATLMSPESEPERARKLRSFKALSAESTPTKTVEAATSTPKPETDKWKTDMLPVTSAVLLTPSSVDETRVMKDGRRRRARSIPDLSIINDFPTRSPYVRSRRNRRGESVDQTLLATSFEDLLTQNLLWNSNSVAPRERLFPKSKEMELTHTPKMSRRKSRSQDGGTQPFSLLALNPHVHGRPRELSNTVNLSDDLESSEKRIRMGTRGTRSISSIETLSQLNGQELDPNEVFENGAEPAPMPMMELADAQMADIAEDLRMEIMNRKGRLLTRHQ